uniref:Transposase n=1 Tax=Macrostomum lignano TaxID=282301 RepID=A0A1I8JKC8_9PLAT
HGCISLPGAGRRLNQGEIRAWHKQEYKTRVPDQETQAESTAKPLLSEALKCQQFSALRPFCAASAAATSCLSDHRKLLNDGKNIEFRPAKSGEIRVGEHNLLQLASEVCIG